MKRTIRPLNKQVITFDYWGVNKGLFGRGEYVSMYKFRDECFDGESCRNSDEHVAFDGQIFFKLREETSNGNTNG